LKLSIQSLETFKPITACIKCLCKTTVYDAVNQTLVYKYGDHVRF